MRTMPGPDWSAWPPRDLCPRDADSGKVTYTIGTHRVATPEQTWAAIQPLFAGAGITRVADLTWLDDLGIPTAQAVRPGALTLSVSQGKAPTLRGAQVSAAMESLESWHAENAVADLHHRTTADLGAELTYRPADLPRPDGSLYHAGTRLDWLRATTLVSGRRTWVPLAAVRVNIEMHDRWGPPMFTMDTNGLASGNTYDEAALYALYEVLERDSLAIGEQSADQRFIDPATVTAPGCSALIALMRSADNDVTIADHTRWTGYPCFDVALHSRSVGGTFGGSGLHHDADIALSRALTEAAQSRLTAISGAREDIRVDVYDRFGQPGRTPDIDDASLARFAFAAAPPTAVRDRLVAAAEAVEQRTGLEPLVVAIDFPGASVPVVRVLAPGLSAVATSDIRSPLAEAGTR